jgi:hypothetical protein
MSSILSFVGGVLKGIGYLGLTVVALGAGFTYLTKPDEKKLFDAVREKHNEQHKDSSASFAQKLLEKTAIYAIEKTSKVDVKDFVFFKYATITLPDGSTKPALGVLQHWFF